MPVYNLCDLTGDGRPTNVAHRFFAFSDASATTYMEHVYLERFSGLNGCELFDGERSVARSFKPERSRPGFKPAAMSGHLAQILLHPLRQNPTGAAGGQ